jgi:hypothetical protein
MMPAFISSLFARGDLRDVCPADTSLALRALTIPLADLLGQSANYGEAVKLVGQEVPQSVDRESDTRARLCQRPRKRVARAKN